MATIKKEERFVKLFIVHNKGGRLTFPLEVPAREFDKNKLPKRCCGYQYFTCLTKNGEPEGRKTYEKFICANSSSIKSREELEKNEEANRKLLDSMGDKYTHVICYRNSRILVKLS